MRRFVCLIALLLSTSLIASANGNGPGSSVAADAKAGRVIEGASKAVPHGTIVVALISIQRDEAKIVNATTPDKKGNFTFTQVPDGNYAIAVSAAVDRETSYAPMLLLPGAEKITPGTYVGTITIPHPTANSWAKVNVPVQSDAPITVTLAAAASVNNNTYPIPWALDIPTFDTSAKGKCLNSGGACTDYTIQLPASPVLVGTYDGTANHFKAAKSASYYLTANAYTQNGSAPNCNPNAIGPVTASVSTSQTSTANPLVFNNCK